MKKKILKEICEKIYMVESSITQGGKQQIINDIKGVVNLNADRF